jgi:glycosyltransferase involved in cell wall biosynthesis
LLEEAIFVREIIGSDALEAAISAERNTRVFIFIPYMFGTTYWGARAAGRAYLIPCIHDESYAYMQLYRQLIESAHGLLFNAPAEERLARRLYRIGHRRSEVLNVGVDLHHTGDAAHFQRSYGIDEPFVLYTGRRDPHKNTPLLFEYFARYRAAGGRLRLVCVGSGMPLPDALVQRGAAVDLGFVPVEDKFDAYAAATVLCQPSRNESFSLVLMEAWSCGTPALVHSDCAVTREFCELSNGGLHFRTYEEFAACLDWLLEHPARARQMGQAGKAYVRQNFDWDIIIGRLLTFLSKHERRRCG